MIYSRKLRPKEKKAFTALGIPKGYNGIFINDMRMSIPYRYKGIGSKVVGKILRNDVSYMLEPIEDGKFFGISLDLRLTVPEICKGEKLL